MKKLFPFILIALIFVQLLAPFTIGSEKKNNFELRVDKNNVEAAPEYYSFTITDVNGNVVKTNTYETMPLCQQGQNAAVKGLATGSTINDCILNTELGTVEPKPATGLPECSIIFPTKIGGCIAQGIYYLFFKTTSFIFGLAGKVLDFTFMYSIKDTSYRSTFVVEGWGILRDFCNMFFIFVLLYIAIGTILNLHSVKTKEMIINVVIIGLLINFSLFATQVIIDASNILTRVFYNPQTIITGAAQTDADGNVTIASELGKSGEIQLSAAIVNKVDPQKIILEASKVQAIPVKTLPGEEQETTDEGISVNTFILIVFLATAFNVVGTIAFLSCALIFIGRVVMLWLAMILAPLAFFSYTVPKLQDIQMVGWKHWWSDTLSMAFVAPVFAFFMYIIVGFMDKGLGMIDTVGKTSLDFVVALVVPFIFIMILLMKAKSIAIKMSGEVGAMMSKAGAAVGGAALGAGIGLAAVGMRRTLGKKGDNWANSEQLKEDAKKKGFVGMRARAQMDLGKAMSKSTFDFRATKMGAAAGKGLGADLSGKALGADFIAHKEGGYAQTKANVQKKKEERAKSLEAGENSHEVHELHAKEEALQKLKNGSSQELESLKARIISKRDNAADKKKIAENAEAAARAPGATQADIANAQVARKDADDALTVVEDLKKQKEAIEKGERYVKDGVLIKDYSGNKANVNVSDSMARKQEEDALAAERVAAKARADELTKTADARAEATTTINQAQVEAQASINKATTDGQASINKATTDGQASIKKANDDATDAAMDEYNASEKLKANPADPAAQAEYNTALTNYNNAQKAARDAVTNAQKAMDDAQTKAQESIQKATDDAQKMVADTKREAETVRDNKIDVANKYATTKTTAATTTRTEATLLRTAHTNGTQVARSIDQLENQDVPDAKFAVSKIDSDRKWEYADNVEDSMFNKKANKHAAHNIRMNAEIKADGKH